MSPEPPANFNIERDIPRCEQCGGKLFWHAVSARHHPAGLGWFFSADQCPACGYLRKSADAS